MFLIDSKGFAFEIPVTGIALVFGILSVFLTIRQNILCWPVSLVAVLAAAFDFYKASIFGDMALQLFYFFTSVYGWIYWSKKESESFQVKKTPIGIVPYLIAATLVQSVIYYLMLVYFNGASPVLDAILTASSLTATYMMIKKWSENWLLWVIIDVTYILLYLLTDLLWYGLLYLFFAIMAYYGWIKWKKAAS